MGTIDTSKTPTGYSKVCPYLLVDDISREIEFLQNVFDAAIKEELKTPDGVIQHGEVTIGEVVLMLGVGSEQLAKQPGMNYVFVQNADETFNKAMQNKAINIEAPTDRFYGIREAGFKDPDGNTWWIGHPIEEVSKEDMEKAFAEQMNQK